LDHFPAVLGHVEKLGSFLLPLDLNTILKVARMMFSLFKPPIKPPEHGMNILSPCFNSDSLSPLTASNQLINRWPGFL
jgi:hypothetical protein